MPSDIVALAVSTGIGVSVLAGILSGVCYVLAHGIKKRRNRRPSAQWHCAVCDGYLRSYEGILEGDRVVTCERCDGRICKFRCSRKDPDKGGWMCNTCSKHATWYQGILNMISPSSRVTYSRSNMNPDRLEDLEEDLEAIRKKQREHVREFIEKIVASMVGGDVDDVSVSRLYNDKHYDAMFSKYHQDLSTVLVDLGSALHISIANDAMFSKYHQDLSTVLVDLGSALHISIANLPVTGESPSTAHATLKHLIQRLLRESLELPSLRKQEEHPAVPADESNRTYEDLLATAILNKVINNCQHNLPSSSANSVSSRLSTSSRHREDGKEYFFGEETLDSKWKTTDLDSTSVSSLEEWIQSDSSIGSTKYVDKVSLTIQHRIEEVTPTDSEADEEEEEDAEYFKNSGLLDEENSNWFLQKRQFKGGHSPVPVPMLVPNPTSEVKVLIGDKEVDDTSDLSDVGSDYGDAESYSEIKSVLIDSKTVIGGKNLLESIHTNISDGELSADSGVKVGSEHFEKETKFRSTPRADKSVDDENVEDVSILSTYSNTEKDTEYTERYGSLPRTILKTPDIILPSHQREFSSNVCYSENHKNKDESAKNGNEEDGYENIEFAGSTYSKKEKEKWKHAVDMKNNPYSKENIEKRLNCSRSSLGSSFGSDYYARLASKPSGGKIKDDESQANTESSDSSWSPVEIVEVNGTDEYTATPAKVVSEEETKKSDITKSPIQYEEKQETMDISDTSVTLSEVTSDSDMSYINCYDVENATVHRQKPSPDIIERPEINGIAYKPTLNEDQIILDIITKQLTDENHNNSQYTDKEMTLQINIIHKDESNSEHNNNKVSIVDVTLKQSHVNNNEDAISTENIVNHEEPAISQQTEQNQQETSKTDGFSVPEENKTNKSLDIHKPQNTARQESQSHIISDRTYRTHVTTVNKKSDNTLIKKIYSDPSVRTFVLQKRENLPVTLDEDNRRPKVQLDKKNKSTSALDLQECTSTKTIHLITPVKRSISSSVLKESSLVAMNEPVQRSDSVTPVCISNSASETNLFSSESSECDITDGIKSLTLEADPEIAELKEKKLVANRLGEFSKSFQNLSMIQGVKPKGSTASLPNTISSIDNVSIKSSNEECAVSVRDLKKRFENVDATSIKDRPIYSLTARSISKQVRENLRNQNLDEPPSIEVVKCDSAISTPEPTKEETQEIIFNAEDKIKFYEKLCN